MSKSLIIRSTPALSHQHLMQMFRRAHEKIAGFSTFLIVSPTPVDPDSAGSALIMERHLKLLGKNCTLFSHGHFPPVNDNALFQFLPEIQFVHTLPTVPPECVIALDYGGWKETKIDAAQFPNAYFIGFDHHTHPALDFPEHGIQIVDPLGNSTTEVLWRFLRSGGYHFSHIMARWGVIGLFGDTGVLKRLKYPHGAYKFLADCTASDIHIEEILDVTRPKFSLSRMEAWTRMFQSVEFDHELRIASLIIFDPYTANELGEKNILTAFGKMQELEEAKCAVLIRPNEKGDAWQIQIRSRDPHRLSAARVAEAVGGGGHHHMAAVREWAGTPDEALDRIRDAVKKYLKK